MLLLPFEPMTDSHLLSPSTCSTLCPAALLCSALLPEIRCFHGLFTRRLPETKCCPVLTSMVFAQAVYLAPGHLDFIYSLFEHHRSVAFNMRIWISGLALFASLVTVTCESKDTLSAEALDEKLERYIALLEKKRDAIDKFLNENYSRFNHTDFDAEDYVAHPINAYMLMKRTSVLWQIAKPGESFQSIHTSNLTNTFSSICHLCSELYFDLITLSNFNSIAVILDTASDELWEEIKGDTA